MFGGKAAATLALVKDAKDSVEIISDLTNSIQKLSDGGDVSHKISQIVDVLKVLKRAATLATDVAKQVEVLFDKKNPEAQAKLKQINAMVGQITDLVT